MRRRPVVIIWGSVCGSVVTEIVASASKWLYHCDSCTYSYFPVVLFLLLSFLLHLTRKDCRTPPWKADGESVRFPDSNPRRTWYLLCLRLLHLATRLRIGSLKYWYKKDSLLRLQTASESVTKRGIELVWAIFSCTGTALCSIVEIVDKVKPVVEKRDNTSALELLQLPTKTL